MKSKRIISLLCAVGMLLSFSACDSKNEEDNDTSSNETTNSFVESTEKEYTENENTEKEDTEKEDTEIKTNSSDVEENYSNKVYYVGTDIPVGNYAVNCTSAEYPMDVIVFADTKAYKSFQNAEKFTVGEFSRAVETHAWANFHLEQDENAYIGLNDGYIVLLNDGLCEFNKYNVTTSSTLYSGIYVVGKDISAGNLDIKCTSDYLKVVTFSDNNTYLKYHKAGRFTVGEENYAIEKYSASTDFIQADNSTSVKLQTGMILLIEDGTGEYSVDKGPVIN